ncbi:MAG: hypothetical protein ACJA1F_002274 [Paracoccaceae bacterium]
MRVQVKHAFGAQTNDIGDTLVRTSGLVPAEATIGIRTLADNMCRL